MSQKFYANFVEVRMVAEDVALLASCLIDPQAQKDPNREPDIQLYMSPVLAKKVVRALGDAVRYYEALFGEIKVEPDPKAVAELQASVPGLKVERNE